MKFRLTETEKCAEDWSYTEDYDTLEEAQNRMKDLYHQLAIEGNPNSITKAEIHERSAIVCFNDENDIEWDIEEID